MAHTIKGSDDSHTNTQHSMHKMYNFTISLSKFKIN